MSDARWGRTEEVIEEDMKEYLDGWKERKVLLTVGFYKNLRHKVVIKIFRNMK